jgi:hypothetical protein
LTSSYSGGTVTSCSSGSSRTCSGEGVATRAIGALCPDRRETVGVDETLAQVLEANRAAAASHAGPLPLPPARRLAVVTCMDARIDPLEALGLQLGDAHVIRVAGARAGEDVLASLAVSAEVGTREALLIGHTDCAGYGSDAEAVAATRAEAGRLREAFPELRVHALLLDVGTGRLETLS